MYDGIGGCDDRDTLVLDMKVVFGIYEYEFLMVYLCIDFILSSSCKQWPKMEILKNGISVISLVQEKKI